MTDTARKPQTIDDLQQQTRVFSDWASPKGMRMDILPWRLWDKGKKLHWDDHPHTLPIPGCTETTLAAREEFDNRRRTLPDALTVLNKRERRIFETRRLAEEQITLVKLAEEFGVSRERVRQIEVSAFAKVQNAVKHHVAAMATAPLQVR